MEEVYEKVKVTAYPDRRMIPSKDFIFLGFNVQIACHFGPFVVFVEDIIEVCTLFHGVDTLMKCLRHIK